MNIEQTGIVENGQVVRRRIRVAVSPMPLTMWIGLASIIASACLLGACGGSDTPQDRPVTITVVGPNAVSYWDEVASNTVNVAGTATGTPEERLPNYAVDLATVHVAMYDAAMAIASTHQPYAVTPASASPTASMEAAVGSAAYRVLAGLFPTRTAQYQAAYDNFLLTVADGTAKTQGLAIGAEVAAAMLTLRANDGRSVVLATYVPGTLPGQFRGLNPINRFASSIKPFAVTSNSQFRAPGPPPITSAAYAADFNETKALGSANSSTRTADQTELARFGTSTPPLYWETNMRVLATTSRSVAEQARLMAMIWVAQADATNTCFESKYVFQAWRPISAITLADTDGNAATDVDLAWTPSQPTPNHPEYPAAHSCITGAMAEVLNAFFGTVNITFDMVGAGPATGITRHFTSTTAMAQEIQVARIAGGMHFRTSTVDGDALGRSVARWIVTHRFQAR